MDKEEELERLNLLYYRGEIDEREYLKRKRKLLEEKVEKPLEGKILISVGAIFILVGISLNLATVVKIVVRPKIPVVSIEDFNIDETYFDYDQLSRFTHNIVAGCGTDQLCVADSIRKYVMRDIQYRQREYFERERRVQTPQDTLEIKSGDSLDISLLIVAMAKSVKIPARVALTGKNPAYPDFYAWPQMYIENNWISVVPDPSVSVGEAPRGLSASMVMYIPPYETVEERSATLSLKTPKDIINTIKLLIRLKPYYWLTVLAGIIFAFVGIRIK